MAVTLNRRRVFNSNGNKNVGCGLNHVQEIEDGKPLGGARSKAED